jgi:hypothetical protein
MNRHRDDRRGEDRVTGGDLRARMRPGYRLIVIDLSPRGALVEAGRPLRPGSFVEVQLETEARRGMVAARVVRCAVAAIDAESGVTYRAGLSFNDACDWVREALTPEGHAVHAGAPGDSSSAAGGGDRLPPARGEAARIPVRGTK